ncbi:MAG: UDP-N-acetylmuramoyl-L-alanine--D-glutamate ligase [Candidatus Pacebacteria bacterium]|nr:UDP-N-acetylmuramoyl-L-alanine--D-glutamate ligase [Candidatus Paceibacterota bacterium]
MNLSKDKIVLVVGLGSSGLSTINWLARNNYPYIGWDDSSIVRKDFTQQNYNIAPTIDTINWSDISVVILSPGVPYRFPKKSEIILNAERYTIPVKGDISLLFFALTKRRAEITYVAITGTNGKSTTTSLVGQVLKDAQVNYLLAGNIGIPVLDLVDDFTGDIIVLELSSYQLDLNIDDYFDIAALLNITPDHLDRHGGLNGYIEVKGKIFANQTRNSLAVIATDDQYTQKLALAINPQQLITASGTGSVHADYTVINGMLSLNADNGTRELLYDLNQSKYLHGDHNHQNAAVAYIICKNLNIRDHQIFESFANYSGLEHRQELVLKSGNMTFINDSKATNADACAPALKSFDNIVWILGGVEKAGGIESLVKYMDRVKLALCYGQSASVFSNSIKQSSTIETKVLKSLEEAVDYAIVFCQSNKILNFTILLSPSAASFDQFKNFEHRGTVFKNYIHKLKKKGRV